MKIESRSESDPDAGVLLLGFRRARSMEGPFDDRWGIEAVKTARKFVSMPLLVSRNDAAFGCAERRNRAGRLRLVHPTPSKAQEFHCRSGENLHENFDDCRDRIRPN